MITQKKLYKKVWKKIVKKDYKRDGWGLLKIIKKVKRRENVVEGKVWKWLILWDVMNFYEQSYEKYHKKNEI